MSAGHVSAVSDADSPEHAREPLPARVLAAFRGEMKPWQDAVWQVEDQGGKTKQIVLHLPGCLASYEQTLRTNKLIPL